MESRILLPSSRGYDTVFLQDELARRRVVIIEGEINQESALEFASKISYLAMQDSKSPIVVLINSPGGEIKAGMVYYDILQSSSLDIKLICVGRAYSMGAVLLASGKQGSRYILPSSDVMLHEPLLGGNIGGNATAIKNISDHLLATREKMNKLLSKHIGKTEEEILEICKEDHYFMAEEAVEFGIVDEIISYDQMVGIMGSGNV